MDYKLILGASNFTVYHSCNCSGTREERYRNISNKEVEFIVYPARQQIATKAKVNGVLRIVCRTGIENLQSEIDKYKM